MSDHETPSCGTIQYGPGAAASNSRWLAVAVVLAAVGACLWAFSAGRPYSIRERERVRLRIGYDAIGQRATSRDVIAQLGRPHHVDKSDDYEHWIYANQPDAIMISRPDAIRVTFSIDADGQVTGGSLSDVDRNEMWAVISCFF